MNFNDFRDRHKNTLKTILVLSLVFLIIYHLFEYRSLMVYDTSEIDKYKEEPNINLELYTQQQSINEIYVDFDKATKRSNVLLQLILDFFVLGLLWQKEK